MPWKATDAMKERLKFVLEWEKRWNEAEGGPVNLAELCRMFGISRPTGYAWIERFRAADFDIKAVAERSRRPKTSPTAIPPELEDLIVDARKLKPKWGPRKLHRMLVDANPGKPIPSASVMSKVLNRRGMTVPRRRRRHTRPAAGVPSPFSGCDSANAVWCMDFKGWFLTGDGVRCYPFTLIDAFSRYLLRCEALVEPDGTHVKKILDSAFQEFGLPLALRSDGGPPFASTGPARLTDLSVWVLQLDTRVEIIAPGKPQQNGRLERFHRTLKAETLPAAEDCRAQQRVFDVWRREYNHERPHEALGQRRPASVYERSPRQYPRPLIKLQFEPFSEVARVDKNGSVRWRQKNVFVSSALRHEYVQFEFRDDGRWDVSWGAIPLGHLDEDRPDRGLIVPRRKRGEAKVSGMSLGRV